MNWQNLRRKLSCCGMALVGSTFIAASAQAVSVLTTLDYSGNVTHLEDNNWEFIVGDADTLLEQDESLVGMAEIQRINWTASSFTFTPVAGQDSTFTAVFALAVDSVVCDPDCTYAFRPLTDAEWDVVQGLYGLPERQDSDSMALIYEDSSNPFVDPAAANRTAALGTATDGTLLWEVGITDTSNFWAAFTNTNDITALNIVTSGFSACVDATFTAAGAPQLLPHDFVGFGVACDLQLIGGFEPLTGGAGANFQAQTDTDFYIRVQQVPEPTSLALLGLGLLLAGPFVRRRRVAST